MIFSIVYLTLSHPVIKRYLTWSWRVLACIQCMLACIHTLETWRMRPFKSTYFVSVYHLGILRVAYIFSRENINIYNTSLVWTFIQFVCAVSFSIEIWIESQPYCSTYHVKIGYLSVTLLSSCKFTMHLHANFKKVVSYTCGSRDTLIIYSWEHHDTSPLWDIHCIL